jgi:hypothetical protein
LTSLEAFFLSFPHDETFPIKKDSCLKKLDEFGGKGFLRPQKKYATKRNYMKKIRAPIAPLSGMLLENGFCKPAYGGKQ